MQDIDGNKMTLWRITKENLKVGQIIKDGEGEYHHEYVIAEVKKDISISDKLNAKSTERYNLEHPDTPLPLPTGELYTWARLQSCQLTFPGIK